MTREKRKKKKSVLPGRRRDLIFYALILAFPVAQFAIFYVGVNFNSVLLAFQDIDVVEGTVSWTFNNIQNVFMDMTQDPFLLKVLANSLLSYALITGIGTPLGLLFSYYIYKKFIFSHTLRVILFLPSIVSAIVMTAIFQFFVESAVPAFIKLITHADHVEGLMENPSTRYATVIFYNIWVGFGTSVLMYSNGMSGISVEMVEAAHIDGCTGLKEFWYITLPMVYSTLSTFIVTGVATIFTSQINLFSFYGESAPPEIQTYGYYLYRMTQSASSVSSDVNNPEFPRLAAMGLLMTFIVVPLTLGVQWLMKKFGPKED